MEIQQQQQPLMTSRFRRVCVFFGSSQVVSKRPDERRNFDIGNNPATNLTPKLSDFNGFNDTWKIAMGNASIGPIGGRGGSLNAAINGGFNKGVYSNGNIYNYNSGFNIGNNFDFNLKGYNNKNKGNDHHEQQGGKLDFGVRKKMKNGKSKREVNKKVLKKPGIQQKVLEATSNEPWGPHGSLLSDIAMASINYHEYQMIMAVIWRRINDTGKNWRHVYKGLIVLEYLVANGSERVIDDIREHAYQISTLSDFQYIDSSARDQGNSVRKKSQSLVALVNDKERIIEVRQKAAINRDKYRNSSMGGMYRKWSGGYGNRYDYDQSSYSNGREREYGHRDDDQYRRYRDSYNRDGDRYRRYENSYNRDGDRYGRDYEDRYGRDGYRDDDYRGRSRGEEHKFGLRSRSSDRYHSYGDDGHLSARHHERKFSEQNIDSLPSYEEAVGESESHVRSARNGENSIATTPRVVSSPHASNNNPCQATSAPDVTSSPVTREGEAFAEFDPRSSTSATPMTTTAAATPIPVASTSSEFDLFGSLSDALAFVPASPSTSEIDAHPNSSATFDDPFGDGPFRATPSTTTYIAQEQTPTSISHVSGVHLPSTNSQFQPQKMTSSNSETDVSTHILPPSRPSDTDASHTSFSAPTGQPSQPGSNMYAQYGQQPQPSAISYAQPGWSFPSPYGQPAQIFPNPYGQHAQPSGNPYGQLGQPNLNNSSLLESLAIVPQESKQKFEPKSDVWADTLSRGLVNLNISGPKTNPLANIGVDFDAINRKEKRLEKPAATPVTSTVTMGKAIGSQFGSRMGRVGATPNPMMGSGMGIGGYVSMNQRPMVMGMGQGAHFQPQTGMPQRLIPENNNRMTGSGGYVSQQLLHPETRTHD